MTSGFDELYAIFLHLHKILLFHLEVKRHIFTSLGDLLNIEVFLIMAGPVDLMSGSRMTHI